MAVVAVGVLACLLLPGVASGQAAVSILGMAWTPKPAPALVISASGPLTFTKAQPEPGVVVLDFPEAALAKPLADVAEPDAGLRRAALTAVDEGGKQWARLRVEADPGATLEVASLPSGVEVRFARAAAAQPAAGAGELDDVLAVADSGGVSVHLKGAGLTGKTFTLENPSRIVVDFPGVVNKVARRVHPVGAAGVVRVRVAQHATAPEPVVRVAVDLEKPLPYHLDAAEDGAVLRIGGDATAAAAAPAPSAPAPEPVASAAAPAAPAPAPATAAPRPSPAAGW